MPAMTDAAAICADLSMRFAYHVDHFEYDKLVELFTPDGVLDRRGVDIVTGRDAILATMKARDPALHTRHVCTNVIIDPIGDSGASGVTYFTLYRGKVSSDDGTIDLSGPAFVGEYHDEFSNSAGDWKIARRRVRLIFQREAV